MEHDNRQPGRGDWLAKMGFRFPDGEDDYLTQPLNCKVTALREAFLASRAGAEHFTSRARVARRRLRIVLIASAVLGVGLAATSFWWLPAVFGVALGDEALVGLVAVLASSLTFLMSELLRR